MPWLIQKQYIPWPTKKGYCSRKCPNWFLVFATKIPSCSKNLQEAWKGKKHNSPLKPGPDCPAINLESWVKELCPYPDPP